MTYAQSNGFGARQGVAIFEYVGPTALTVIGARTGRKYGFTPGGRSPGSGVLGESAQAAAHPYRVLNQGKIFSEIRETVD